ncbi:MAG TPA: trypsin-like peptidase domain-containing protein [Burkholderiales bacterium]
MARVLLLALALLYGCALPQRDFSALVEHEAAAVVKVGVYSASALADEDAVPASEDDELAQIIGRLIGGLNMPTLGSGFLISEDGYIITNAHLVADAQADGLVVRLADHREFRAALVGADAVSDIALLKIPARGLPRARLGSSKAVQPGQWVAAIGSPLGLEHSVTAGIVSAVGRTLPEESYLPFIQTDVAINPGNSGGPLFNVHGEVVGVNSVIYSLTGGFMGVSFAIPIDLAMEVAHELKARGRVTRGRIGVRLQELTAELASALHAPERGALVVDVIAGSAADRAGLRSADVIVGFGAKAVSSHVELMRTVAQAQPGETVRVYYARDGVLSSVRITVEEARPTSIVPEPARASQNPFCLLVAPLEALRAQRLGVESGVVVRRADGPAQRAGLQAGDVILSVNGVAVATPKAFGDQLRAAGKGPAVALLVQREGARSFIALPVPE